MGMEATTTIEDKITPELSAQVLNMPQGIELTVENATEYGYSAIVPAEKYRETHQPIFVHNTYFAITTNPYEIFGIIQSNLSDKDRTLIQPFAQNFSSEIVEIMANIARGEEAKVPSYQQIETVGETQPSFVTRRYALWKAIQPHLHHYDNYLEKQKKLSNREEAESQNNQNVAPAGITSIETGVEAKNLTMELNAIPVDANIDSILATQTGGTVLAEMPTELTITAADEGIAPNGLDFIPSDIGQTLNIGDIATDEDIANLDAQLNDAEDNDNLGDLMDELATLAVGSTNGTSAGIVNETTGDKIYPFDEVSAAQMNYVDEQLEGIQLEDDPEFVSLLEELGPAGVEFETDTKSIINQDQLRDTLLQQLEELGNRFGLIPTDKSKVIPPKKENVLKIAEKVALI